MPARRRDGALPLAVRQHLLITGFHGLHVLSGTLYNAVVLINTMRDKFTGAENYNQVEIAGLFWHFVDLVWILVFTFVYLV